jgi:glutamate-1-semialdehyde 2,1-aminomutase
VPLARELLRRLRELTRATGTLLVFDEVVTGFRWAPGGVQELAGVTPDLTTLAKVLAGGLPGGAVAGPHDVMEVLEFREPDAVKVAHPGTHNAHPLAAAAGVATLTACSSGTEQAETGRRAAGLRARLNDVLARRGAPGAVYGESSTFHITFDPQATPGNVDDVEPRSLKLGVQGDAATGLHCGMLLRGVHLFHASGFLSPAHADEDLDATVAAFDDTVAELRHAGLIDG